MWTVRKYRKCYSLLVVVMLIVMVCSSFIRTGISAYASEQIVTNYTKQNATHIELDTDIIGYFDDSYNYGYYYKFTLEKDTVVVLALSFETDDELALYLSDDNGMYYYCHEFKAIHESLPIGLKAGTYYVSVRRKSINMRGYYNLGVATYNTKGDYWEYEPNNDVASASKIQLNQEVHCSADRGRISDDFFYFMLSSETEVSIEISGEGYGDYCACSAFICDLDGNDLQSASASDGQTGFEAKERSCYGKSWRKKTLGPGKYIVRADGLNVTYKFKVCADVPDSVKVQDFVTRLYNVALNREPDAAGLADWTNRLTSGQAQAVNIVQGIMCSPEYLNKGKSNGEIVNDCYKAMLGRDADEGGYNDWVTKLDNGMTVEAIFAGFVGSQEFMNLCNSYGIQPGTYAVTDPRDQNQGVTAYVSRLYTQALGRGYDPAGLSDWCGRILANPSRENIVDVAATGFFHSQEFQNKGLNNEEYVKVLYRTFLGRECDPNGLADWVGQLDRGEKTRDEILPGFANSQEFTNIMAHYGL